MKSALILILLSLALVLPAVSQERRDWLKMTVEDATKTLNSSPWAQTQTETDTSEMFWSPTRPGTASAGQEQQVRVGAPLRDQQVRNNNRADRGALNQAVSVNYHVRFFSSKPIREALSRIVLFSNPEPGPGAIEQWQGFVDRDFGPFVVVTVSYDSTDRRLLGPTIQAFASATHNTLRNNTYLERSDGKRVYLMDYREPTADGLGAKFIFPRLLDGEPFLSSPKGSVRFVSEMASTVKLNVRFNLANMVVQDKLEY
jgi:hypothetical protein